MENKRQEGSSSSSSSSINHLFGPKDSSPSSTSAVLSSIFPPTSTGLGRESTHGGKAGSLRKQGESNKGGSSVFNDSKDVKSSVYKNETTEPSYLSSSIYYGGQENYSPRTRNTESHHVFKKDGGEEDPNGSNANSASRGNWWQGSLYY